MKRILFVSHILFVILGLFQGDFLYSDSHKNIPYTNSSSNFNLLSIIPFHFPMEATLAPDYKPSKVSIGAEILSSTLPMNYFFSKDLSSSTLLLDVPISEREILGLSPNPTIQNLTFPYRNPGIVLIFAIERFQFHMDLNWIRIQDFSHHSQLRLFRPSIGITYNLPDHFLPNQLTNANINMNLQSYDYQYTEDRLKRQNISLNKNLVFTPGFSIGTKKGWALEADIRMLVPGSREEFTESFVKNDLQGRIGLKWYLPELIKP